MGQDEGSVRGDVSVLLLLDITVHIYAEIILRYKHGVACYKQRLRLWSIYTVS